MPWCLASSWYSRGRDWHRSWGGGGHYCAPTPGLLVRRVMVTLLNMYRVSFFWTSGWKMLPSVPWILQELHLGCGPVLRTARSYVDQEYEVLLYCCVTYCTPRWPTTAGRSGHQRTPPGGYQWNAVMSLLGPCASYLPHIVEIANPRHRLKQPGSGTVFLRIMSLTYMLMWSTQ